MNINHLQLPNNTMDRLTPLLSTLESFPTSLPHTHHLNDIVSIITIIILFWPILSNLLRSILTATNWIFWLLTSLLFGIVQFGYVSYQFFRIGWDLVGLVLLKTFAMLRHQMLNYGSLLGVWSKTTKNKTRDGSGKRREWRRKLKEATCFADFVKIELDEPSDEDDGIMVKDCDDTASDMSLSSDSDIDDSSRHSDDTTTTSKMRKSPSFQKLERCIDAVSETVRNRISKSQSCVDLPMHDSPSTKPKQHPSRRSSSDNNIPRSQSQINLSSVKTTTTATPSSAHHHPITDQIRNTTQLLRSARRQFEISSSPSSLSNLNFLLSAVVKRNHLGLDDTIIDNARSLATSGKHALSSQTRSTLDNYMTEIERCLSLLSDSPTPNPSILPLLHKLKQNTGRTALMLSGGGAQAMNHLGILRALVESGVYDAIPVISGTSGGSAVAGMCAVMTSQELLNDVCVPTLSTDYGGNGVMKKLGIRWSPTLVDMGLNWFKTGLLFSSLEFKRLCDFYFKDVTFEEAYKKTGKHVCISVSASRSGNNGREQRLLLNHVSTPHVTIASAVAASCALPGLMTPAKLQAKDAEGNVILFEVDGTEWVDGSIQADIPFQRISTLFNVSNYIVCQVNFHVVPFLHKPHHPSMKSLYWRLFQILEWDIRNRALNLSRLGLFPKLFGQDVSNMFKQRYHGHLTIVPHFTKAQVFGLKVLINPSVEDMKVYIRNGEMATWPYVNVIDQMLRIETAIERSLDRLEKKLQLTNTTTTTTKIPPVVQNNNNNNDNKEKDNTTEWKDRFMELEKENQSLRRQVEWLKGELLMKGQTTSKSSDA